MAQLHIEVNEWGTSNAFPAALERIPSPHSFRHRCVQSRKQGPRRVMGNLGAPEVHDLIFPPASTTDHVGGSSMDIWRAQVQAWLSSGAVAPAYPGETWLPAELVALGSAEIVVRPEGFVERRYQVEEGLAAAFVTKGALLIATLTLAEPKTGDTTGWLSRLSGVALKYTWTTCPHPFQLLAECQTQRATRGRRGDRGRPSLADGFPLFSRLSLGS